MPSRINPMALKRIPPTETLLSNKPIDGVDPYSSDTMPGNRARVSKPIEITDRGILVCHQRRIKHPSCARLAARREAKNVE
jgi:hypothetical protein